jgi:hypothetical protein
MRSFISVLQVTLILMLSALVQAETQNTESYGVYIKSGDGWLQIQKSTAPNIRRDFTGIMFDFPVIDREGDALELLVHHPDFYPEAVLVQARPMAVAGGRHGMLGMTITPKGDNRYVIAADQPVADDYLVLVQTGCCFGGVYGAALSNPRQSLLESFGRDQEHNVASAEQVVGLVAEVFPDDPEVTDLHAYWKGRVKQREATRIADFIETLWASYESAESPAARIKYLQNVRNNAKHYLKEFPDGLERNKMQQLHDKAAIKLDV